MLGKTLFASRFSLFFSPKGSRRVYRAQHPPSLPITTPHLPRLGKKCSSTNHPRPIPRTSQCSSPSVPNGHPSSQTPQAYFPFLPLVPTNSLSLPSSLFASPLPPAYPFSTSCSTTVTTWIPCCSSTSPLFLLVSLRLRIRFPRGCRRCCRGGSRVYADRAHGPAARSARCAR